MAWIRLEQNLKSHPKFLKLRSMVAIDEDCALGRLALLWLWSSNYALDGDLRKFDHEVIEAACKIPVKILMECNFVDKRPYFRIHDWWDYVGGYLKIRFQDRPEKWKRIKTLYDIRGNHRSNTRGNPSGNCVSVDLIPLTSLTSEKDSVDLSANGKSTDSLMLLKPTAGHVKNCTCEICWTKTHG